VVDVQGPDHLPVARCIAHDGGGVIEAHGLVIEERRVEGRRMMRLEIRAGIGEEREARRVGIVDDKVIGNEIMIAFHAEIIRFTNAYTVNGSDSIPVHIGFGQAFQFV
jgi:hypothetical protein